MNFRLALIALLLCIAGVPAHAQYLKCASHQLTSADSRAVRKVMTHVAGQHEVLWPSMTACVNRRGALAFADVKEEPQPDGSFFTYSMFCQRERTPWTCEVQQTRRARLVVDVDGRPTHFDLGLPMGFDLQRAKTLVIRASDVGPTATIEQECGHSGGEGSSSASELLQAIHDTFRFSAPMTIGSIEDNDGTVSMDVNSWILKFAPDPDDASKFDFRCWTYEIVVT